MNFARTDNIVQDKFAEWFSVRWMSDHANVSHQVVLYHEKTKTFRDEHRKCNHLIHLPLIGSSDKLTHSKHCHVSLSSGRELMLGMWQFWWNTLGHLSQHISSPPSRQTAHQSSLGSSLLPFFSAQTIISYRNTIMVCVVKLRTFRSYCEISATVHLWRCCFAATFRKHLNAVRIELGNGSH